ncbi:MAG: A/G-specific adenine glycosylase [Flavobacteriaceae bacterium]|nr:A/G-specific adenine glycosylase [Flavobacteriaceae bacterium]
MIFSNTLIHWYLKNKRDLPWRNTRNPYNIWISEIMLQQTRVAQGLPYYLDFINVFPTVFDLAKAPEEKVLKHWQGLGYYSRARNLHFTAQYIANELKGEFPNNYYELLKLKGIGEYTAAAIASFSFNEAVPVVDGNVFRVLSRYFDIETDISSSIAKKEFSEMALALIPKNNPATFNQAIMEFGAIQCIPKNPNCFNCIFITSCAAFQKKKVQTLPVKNKKIKISNRFFNYIVFEDEYSNTLIQKRTQKEIWQNLYEFPLIETDTELNLDAISKLILDKYNKEYHINSISNINVKGKIHKLSHQHLNINFWKVKVKGVILSSVNKNNIKNFPFPKVIFNFIEEEYMELS